MAQRIAPMEAGERDRLVTLQQLTESVGTSGFPKETWTTLVSDMPAARFDLRQAEKFRASQLSAPYDVRWEINYRADMDPEIVDVTKKRRLVYRGREHDIVGASMIGRKDGIELLTLARPV